MSQSGLIFSRRIDDRRPSIDDRSYTTEEMEETEETEVTEETEEAEETEDNVRRTEE